MDAEKAKQLAVLLGGEAWQSGGGMWLVLLKREDGKLVVVSDDAVAEYEDYEAFENGIADAEIDLI